MWRFLVETFVILSEISPQRSFVSISKTILRWSDSVMWLSCIIWTLANVCWMLLEIRKRSIHVIPPLYVGVLACNVFIFFTVSTRLHSSMKLLTRLFGSFGLEFSSIPIMRSYSFSCRWLTNMVRSFQHCFLTFEILPTSGSTWYSFW